VRQDGAVNKASNWLREERRRTLGDWVAFCVECGHAQRYFEETEGQVPGRCPQCGGEMRLRCPACGARVASMFAIECEACGASLRPPDQDGTRIRKPGK
jgi:ribosomal protein S27E